MYEVKEQKAEFLVVEKETNYIVESFDNRKDANELQNKLENGYGFDGHIPAFFLNKGKIVFNYTFSVEE